ncbi:WD40-repeat-containing domain protein [Schizophyllum fasciatum]
MSGGNIYNPSAPGQALPGAPRGFSLSARLDEHLDLIRQDYELMAGELSDARVQKEDLEAKVAAQINELTLISNTVLELNNKHARLRQTYEQEVTALRAQLHEAQRQAALAASAHHSVPAVGPGVPVSMPAKLAAPGPSTPQVPPQMASERGTPRGPPGTAQLPSAPPPAALPPPAGADASASTPAPPPVSSGASFLDDLDSADIPPEFRKEGSDWYAIFNPNTKRVLDVSLMHSLMHETVVCCVRFSADGKFLATGCNRTAQIFDVQTGRKTCVLVDESPGRTGDLYIRSVCFSPDGKYLATGAEDRQIRIWDIAKKSIKHIFDGHQQEIYSLEFSYNGRLIVSGSGDKTARVWDMQEGTSKVLAINDQDSLNADAGVTSVAISPDGRLVAAGSLDTAVRLWDVESGVLLERLRGHRDSVYSVAFTPDGKGLISGSLDKTLKYWDVSGLARGGARRAERRGDAEKGSLCTMNFTGHKDYVLSVAVSPDGQWVVSGSKDRGVQFWDSRTAIVQCMLQGHKNSVISIDLSPAGGMLATGSGDWHARIFADRWRSP